MNTARYAPSQRAHDLALLAASYETGWWDDDGRPAPWPEDFWLTDGTINPDWQPYGHREGETDTATEFDSRSF